MYNDDDEKDDGDDDDDYEDCRASVKRLSSLARARTWLAPRFVPKQSRANIAALTTATVAGFTRCEWLAGTGMRPAMQP